MVPPRRVLTSEKKGAKRGTFGRFLCVCEIGKVEGAQTEPNGADRETTPLVLTCVGGVDGDHGGEGGWE